MLNHVTRLPLRKKWTFRNHWYKGTSEILRVVEVSQTNQRRKKGRQWTKGLVKENMLEMYVEKVCQSWKQLTQNLGKNLDSRGKQFKEKEANYLTEFCRAAFLKVLSTEHLLCNVFEGPWEKTVSVIKYICKTQNNKLSLPSFLSSSGTTIQISTFSTN